MHDYPYRSRQPFSNNEDPLNNGRRSYNFQNMQKSVQLSQTDKRIEEIKRKYDTPNRRERISQLSVKKSDFSNNKENQNYGTADFKVRVPVVVTETEGSEADMRESKAIANSRLKFFNVPTSGSKSFIASGGFRQKQSLDYKITSNKLYTNENEEEFFKRVKEMKQSLLSGDNVAKATELKTSAFFPTQKEPRGRSGFQDSNQAVEKDRIDNIDKINQKIKEILECLNENEKTRIPSKYDPIKRSTLESEKEPRFNTRDNIRTPIKNPVTSSILGKQNFANHRHERSQILDKFEINREFKDQIRRQTKQSNKEDDRWEKLSSKLQKYELQNKLRIQRSSLQSEKEPELNTEENTQTLVKNPVASSISSKQSFGNHRHEKSQILDKFDINRDFKDQARKQTKQNNKEDDRLEKLSSKLQKYELQNKLRIQRAADFAKQIEGEISNSRNDVQNIRREREGKISNMDVKKSIQIVRRDNRSMDMSHLRSRSFLNNETPNIKELRDRSLHTRDFTDKKDLTIKSGKKLDDEIDRIQKKIQQFEEEKKRLGVNFTPFNYSNTKSAANIRF